MGGRARLLGGRVGSSFLEVRVGVEWKGLEVERILEDMNEWRWASDGKVRGVLKDGMKWREHLRGFRLDISHKYILCIRELVLVKCVMFHSRSNPT